MQFAREFIAVSSTGMTQMDYLALPVTFHSDTDAVTSADTVGNGAWDAIRELLFDDESKAFVDAVKRLAIPVPNEDDIGYEVEGDDGEVVATVEIAWPDKKIGFITEEQIGDKEKLETMGWTIIGLFDAADAVNLFRQSEQESLPPADSIVGGDNE